MNETDYYIYILSSRSTVLYVGMTSDLLNRVWQHKEKLADGFTRRYSVDRLVFYEAAGSLEGATNREHQLKVMKRAKKMALIESFNPEWKDLYFELVEQANPEQKPVIKHNSRLTQRDSRFAQKVMNNQG